LVLLTLAPSAEVALTATSHVVLPASMSAVVMLTLAVHDIRAPGSRVLSLFGVVQSATLISHAGASMVTFFSCRLPVLTATTV
jgi:hypothetical protein